MKSQFHYKSLLFLASTKIVFFFSTKMKEDKRKTLHECKCCDKSYKSEGTLRFHIKLKHNSMNFECDICNKRFPTSFQLRAHIKLHSEPTYKCELCEKMFKLKPFLSQHRKNVHGGKERMYKCDTC